MALGLRSWGAGMPQSAGGSHGFTPRLSRVFRENYPSFRPPAKSAVMRLPLFVTLGLSLELACGATLPSLTHTRVKLHDGAGSRRGNPKSSALTLEKPVAKQKVPPALEGVAVPFVSIDPTNQTLQLHPAALEALGRVPAPVCVLGMSGTARDGKSTWLNMYAQWLRNRWETNAVEATRDFDVGHDLDTCTTGGWMQILTGSERQPLLPGSCV